MDQLPGAEYGLLGVMMVGILGIMALMMRTWSQWLQRKLDEKNRFAERMLEHTQVLAQLTEVTRQMQMTQRELLDVLGRLATYIHDDPSRMR